MNKLLILKTSNTIDIIDTTLCKLVKIKHDTETISIFLGNEKDNNNNNFIQNQKSKNPKCSAALPKAHSI